MRFPSARIAWLVILVAGVCGEGLADYPLPPRVTGNLYVSSYGTDEVFCFDPDGSFLFKFDHEDLDGPRGLAFSSEGELYVGSQSTDRVLVFDSDGGYLRQFTAPGLDGPTSVAFSPDSKLYVSSFSTDEVFVFDDEVFEKKFTADGLNGPNCIAFGPAGEIFVASQLDNRVYLFNAAGDFEERFTGGGVRSPMGIAIYRERLYLTGGASNTVAVFDLGGNFISNLDTDPPVTGPQGIAFDDTGRFVTASFYTDTVAYYSPDGGVEDAIEGMGIRTGRSVAFRPLPAEEALFVRGDFKRDGDLDITDAITTLSYLFLDFDAGDSANCLDAGDTNDDGGLDLSDAVYSFDYLFLGGEAPPPPFPLAGGDPTGDPLGCR